MNLMRWWLKLWNGSAEDLVLDHVPVSGELPNHWRKLLAARRRHGKRFHTKARVQRVEPPSRDLLELQQAGMTQKTNQIEVIEKVRPLKERAR